MSSKSKSAPESRVPGWVWLFTGILLGALIMFLMRLSELQPQKPAPKAPSVKPVKETKEPRFEFYDLLRDTEVTVPTRKESTDKTPAKPAAEKVEYLLQVASFKTAAEAEQMRAELTLLNLRARIEEAKLGQGETWHRVMVGPYNSRGQMSKARSALISNRYEALLLTRKAAG